MEQTTELIRKDDATILALSEEASISAWPFEKKEKFCEHYEKQNQRAISIITKIACFFIYKSNKPSFD